MSSYLQNIIISVHYNYTQKYDYLYGGGLICREYSEFTKFFYVLAKSNDLHEQYSLN